MWSPEARAQAFEFHPPVHLVEVHRTPPVVVVGVISIVGVVGVIGVVGVGAVDGN